MKEISEYPLILTATDISNLLRVSKPTAYEIMSQSSFPLLRIGRCKRVLRDDFFEWLKRTTEV
jgi:excisionase family DNA binding protein